MTVHQLIETHMPLAEQIASIKRRTLPACVQLDELKSAAYMGLVDAANKYKEEVCDNFKVYAGIRITGAIQDYLRELGWGSRHNPQKVTTLADEHQAKSEPTNELIFKITKGLTSQGGEVLKSYYVEGKTQEEIGREIGLKNSRICQILRKSHDQIRSTWDQQELWDEVA